MLRDAADIDKAMAMIEKDSRRMSQLVDDMLLLARLEEGTAAKATLLDFSDVVNAVVEEFRQLYPDTPVTVDAPPTVDISGDVGLLRRVVHELVLNAEIHTPAATSIEARIEMEGAVVSLTVRDHGPGLGPEPSRVFVPLSQNSESRTREAGGGGLGLSIVAAIVAAHGGVVSASNVDQGGALITVTLPTEDVEKSKVLRHPSNDLSNT